MYERIIVPIDGSDAALRALIPGAALAARERIPIELVIVVSSRGVTPEELDQLDARARSLIGVEVETRLEFDEDPAVGVVRAVREQPRALVCLTTHGRGGLREVLLGSVARRVLGETHRPTLLVGPHFDEARPFELASMAVCLDGSPTAEAILPVAAAWARQFGTRLHLVQVVEPTAEAPTAAARIPLSYTDSDSYLARRATEIGAEIGNDVRPHVLGHQVPAAAITEFAEGNGVSLVAMTTHGETGLARIALGSVATAVARASQVPLLVLHPDLR